MTPEQVLGAGLDELALDLPASGQGRLLEYLRLMDQWNRVYNLSAVRSGVDAVSVHLLDSLAITKMLPEASTLDVGSGAGLPGLPLAIARPQMRVTMVESNGKKAAFIRHAISRLGLRNAEVIEDRVEQWQTERRFPAIVSRAFAELAAFVRIAGRLLAPGGRLYAMKGRFARAEASALPAPWTLLEARRIHVPGLDAERHVVVIGAGTP
jgi:16S rRNA (guanine527-N7)-methyltransferase